MNKILSILLVICLVLLGISVAKNLDYAQQISDLEVELKDTEEELSEAVTKGYDIGYKHCYSEGYSEGYVSEFDKLMEEVAASRKPQIQEMPTSGTIVSGQQGYGSTLTIKSDSDSACVVSLKTTQGVERMAFFVRAGDTVTVNVPAETLYAYFAYGNTWYGYGEGLMFGEDTVYSRDDEALYFGQYTYTYTLYPTYNGNFTETPSDEDEFFG